VVAADGGCYSRAAGDARDDSPGDVRASFPYDGRPCWRPSGTHRRWRCRRCSIDRRRLVGRRPDASRRRARSTSWAGSRDGYLSPESCPTRVESSFASLDIGGSFGKTYSTLISRPSSSLVAAAAAVFAVAATVDAVETPSLARQCSPYYCS